MNYFDELKRSMNMLSDEGYIFMGQSVKFPGNAIHKTLDEVEYKIEMPVAEDMQMGMSIGMALEGIKIVSIFPRMDFLICAMNQLVNHLDKLSDLSHDLFTPKIIIRTAVGSKKPLDAGLQHTGNYIALLRAGLKNVDVVELNYAPASCDLIYGDYVRAKESKRSTILVEYGDLY